MYMCERSLYAYNQVTCKGQLDLEIMLLHLEIMILQLKLAAALSKVSMNGMMGALWLCVQGMPEYQPCGIPPLPPSSSGPSLRSPP